MVSTSLLTLHCCFFNSGINLVVYVWFLSELCRPSLKVAEQKPEVVVTNWWSPPARKGLGENATCAVIFAALSMLHRASSWYLKNYFQDKSSQPNPSEFPLLSSWDHLELESIFTQAAQWNYGGGGTESVHFKTSSVPPMW